MLSIEAILSRALLLLLLCQVLSNKSSILTSLKLKVGLPGALCLVMIKTLQTWEGSSSVESCWSKWRQIDFVLNSRHQGWRKWREERDKGHWAVRVVWGRGAFTSNRTTWAPDKMYFLSSWWLRSLPHKLFTWWQCWRALKYFLIVVVRCWITGEKHR